MCSNDEFKKLYVCSNNHIRYAIELNTVNEVTGPTNKIFKGLTTQCKAKANFHFSCEGFCHIQYFYLAKSLPRKVKVCFSFALGSQPFRKILGYYFQISWDRDLSPILESCKGLGAKGLDFHV